MAYRKLVLTLCLSFASIVSTAQTPSSDPQSEVHLPPLGTLFALDQGAKGPTIVQIHPTEILTNGHAGSNLARSMVYAGPHESVEIKGENAALSLHTNQPTFYLRLMGDDAETMRNRITLLRLHPSKDRRVVIDMSVNVFGGHLKRKTDEVPLAKSDLPDGILVKLLPQAALEPGGEYALVFMPKDGRLFADTVYDFNIAKSEIKPTAPAASK